MPPAGTACGPPLGESSALALQLVSAGEVTCTLQGDCVLGTDLHIIVLHVSLCSRVVY